MLERATHVVTTFLSFKSPSCTSNVSIVTASVATVEEKMAFNNLGQGGKKQGAPGADGG